MAARIAAIGLLAAGLVSGGCAGTRAAAGPRAEWVGSWVWTRPAPDFGGLSGIDTDAEGRSFVAVGDVGTILTGRLQRDAQGRVTGVADLVIRRLADEDGRPLAPTRHDAEGVALLPGGGIAVSFEQQHRVAIHPGPAAAARPASAGLDTARFEWNGGLEALAAGPEGDLWAIPERIGMFEAAFPVWRRAGGSWSVVGRIPRDGLWRPVGADFGPDGRLYLLERDFWGFLGFLSRVRRFDLRDGAPTGGTVLFETRAGVHDNLEGIAVWRDARGALRLTMVSDDNRRALQRTEIVDYRVEE